MDLVLRDHSRRLVVVDAACELLRFAGDRSENFGRSMLPPLTTRTIFPVPQFPLRPAATAPSAMTWFRSAMIRIARRVRVTY